MLICVSDATSARKMWKSWSAWSRVSYPSWSHRKDSVRATTLTLNASWNRSPTPTWKSNGSKTGNPLRWDTASVPSTTLVTWRWISSVWSAKIRASTRAVPSTPSALMKSTPICRANPPSRSFKSRRATSKWTRSSRSKTDPITKSRVTKNWRSLARR